MRDVTEGLALVWALAGGCYLCWSAIIPMVRWMIAPIVAGLAGAL